MAWSIIPSSSLGEWKVETPSWAQPTVWLPVEVGCLARVLPIGGPIWMNELVVVLEEMKVNGTKFAYRVAGRLGETTLPYYALDIQMYPSGSINRRY
ncbi:MAG: hypothetical protein EBU90_24205 [Proteobacteria bacterium]|nr:hypothetical protein [Pseudomonadota bacterium]